MYLELVIIELEHDELRHLQHFETDWSWFIDLCHYFLEVDCGEVVSEHAEALAVRFLCQFYAGFARSDEADVGSLLQVLAGLSVDRVVEQLE